MMKIQVQEEEWTVEIRQYIQGFKKGSFSAQYAVVKANVILWLGTVFVDQEAEKEHSYLEYRDMNLSNALNTLDVLVNATLGKDLTDQEVSCYFRDQLKQRGPAAIPHLATLRKDFVFCEKQGHRLSDVFIFELEGVSLYGFLQELGHSTISREGGKEAWKVYVLYAGLGQGEAYPIGNAAGIKGVFHQDRGLGACWIKREGNLSLLEQMCGVFECLEWVESYCFPATLEGSCYQIQAIRQGHQVDVKCLTEDLDYSQATIEGVLGLITELQNLISGVIRLDELSWEYVLELIEDMDLWFILEYQGFQPFTRDQVRGILKQIGTRTVTAKRMKDYLTQGDEFLSDEDEVSKEPCILNHYELAPSLRLKPLTEERAREIMDLIVVFLTEFYKIDYINLSY